MASNIDQYAVLFVLGILVLTVSYSLAKTRRYPPGPPGIPVIGNLHKLENDFRYKFINKISKSYDDFLFFHNPVTSVLALTSYHSMQDLLVSRGSIYSDRPGSSIVEMMGTRSLVTETFGPKWKTERKLFHQHMNKGVLPQYWPTVEEETKRCLKRLHRNPDNWKDELRLNTVRVILGITYGTRDVESTEDERVTAANKLVAHIATTLTPGLLWINIFPILKWIPGWVPWLGNEIKLISTWGEEDRTAIFKPFNYVKSQKDAGTAKPSFALNLLEERATDEQTMTWLSASMYSGGADTTFIMLHAFVLAMVLYPEAQKKAQDEIDRVVGTDRLPGMQDQGSLPYVDNLIKEVIRWWSIAPITLGHRLTDDDEYKGYFIPKGTIVLPCIWCISRDEEMYPDPETFRPERFDELNASGQLPLDPHKFSFGIGRRICPGQDFADMVLFSNIVAFLATTTFSKSLDAQGNEITPTTTPIGPVTRYPRPFKCKVELRPAAALLDVGNQTV